LLVKRKIGRSVRVKQERRVGDPRHDLLEHFDPFAAQRRLDVDESRDVAAGVRQARDKSASNGIGNDDEDDRNRFRFAL
jgi:hypothetical protein